MSISFAWWIKRPAAMCVSCGCLQLTHHSCLNRCLNRVLGGWGLSNLRQPRPACFGATRPGLPLPAEGESTGQAQPGSRARWPATPRTCPPIPAPPGTTAHVGIMLYGADSRSGHRHLDGDGAFHRNSLDIFQIATPHSLGSVWKIRVWHDNKGLWTSTLPQVPGAPPPAGLSSAPPGLTPRPSAGLSPAWFLQHVIVRDLQSAHSTFFLVNDWLSVETEANGGLVEKEVLAASKAPPRRAAGGHFALGPPEALRAPQVTRPCGGSGASWWPSCSADSLTSTSGSPCGTGRLGAASLASSGPPAVPSSSASSWVPMPCGTGSWEMLPTGRCQWGSARPPSAHPSGPCPSPA